MNSYTTLKTPIDDLLLVADHTHLLGIYFCDKKHAPDLRGWQRDPNHPVLKQAARELQAYFAGKLDRFTVPMRFEGTPFQQAVWKQIERIPFGKTITYTELAERAGAPTARRAAGTATGRNPLAIVIPCHRVVGKNGGLGGFAGGLERKRHLLGVEKIAI